MIYQNPERSQKYLFLIEQLLRSPQSQYQSILDDNYELLDTRLIEIMKQRAEAEKNMGNIQNYELLNSITDRLNKTLASSFSSNLDRGKKQNIESSSSNNFNQPETKQKIPKLPEAQQIVLVDIFRNIEQYGTNTEIIYPILQKHLSQFNLEFAENLRHWATVGLSQISTQSAQTFALFLVNFSGLMLYFPFGNRITNIAISRAGFESSLTFFTRENFPEVYAELMINLGIAVEEDLLADSVQKWEEAIACYQKASEIFTREVNPERWAFIQENLGNAYRNREQGESEINLRQSITFYQNALQVFTVEENRQKWGLTQNNLGNSYLQLSSLSLKESREDKEQLRETAIHCYEKALQTLTKDTYPDNWALTQMTLGQAYAYRLLENPNDNYEKAQQYFENALSVYTPTSNPYYYQQVKANQQKLQKLIEALSYIDSVIDNIENKEDFSFIVELFKLIIVSQGGKQELFPFLEKNLPKFNQEFPQKFEFFISLLLSTTNKEILDYFTEVIGRFSSLIRVFPQGIREINLNVFIIGMKVVLDIYRKENKHLNLPLSLGMIKLSLGADFYEKYDNKWGDALVNLEEAINFFEQGFAVLNYENASEQELWLSYKNKLGVCYVDRNLMKGDINDIEKAINAYASALNYYPEKTLDWAMVQMNIGNAYCNRQGNPLHNLNQAIECYEKSLMVRKQETYPTEWADVQQNLGAAYYRRGMLGHSESAEDIEKAIECNKNALKVYKDANKYPSQWAKSQLSLGIDYSDRRKGNYAENLELAIDHLNQCLTVRTKEAYPYEWAITQKNLGAIYRQRAQGGRGNSMTSFKLGIECNEKALQVFTPEKYPVDWAETQHNLTGCYINFAKLTEPRENLKKAIACATNAINQFLDNPQKLANVKFELGTCYKNLALTGEEREKNLTLAIKCYQDSLGLTSRESKPFAWAETKNSLGNAYQHNGQYQDAIKSYQDALLVHTRHAFPTDYIKTVVNIGNAHTKYEKLTDAFKSYQEAINVFEDLLYGLGTDDDAKRKLGEEWFRIYRLMISTCLKLGKEKPGYYATAWEYVERSKTRRLVEFFGQTKPANVSDANWKEFQDLRNQITNQEKWIEDREELIISSGESVKQPELDTRKNALINLKQQLNRKLETNPQLAIGQQIQYTSFSNLGEKLSDDSTVILQWYILENGNLYAFIYNLQSSQPYVWESSYEDFKKLYQWHQEYLLTYYSNYKIWVDELQERLHSLSEILHIDELLCNLPQNCQQIIVIPHLFLHLLPIHALPIKSETWEKFNPNSAQTNQTHYLFECFAKGVRYAPSFQILQNVKNQKSPNYNHLFAVQNPTLDLKYTNIEVEVIQEFFDNSDILKKEDANKENLNAWPINLAHFLHFSCHGSFNFNEPLKSALILSQAQVAEVKKLKNTRYISLREGDSFDLQKCLTLEEIFSLNLTQCYLVTLSACETGLTDISSTTDEYIGLPSSFLYAGASNVVSSLWLVNDLSTTFFMIKFYENLNQQLKEKNEKNVALALGNAQLWLKQVDKTQLEDWLTNIPLRDINHETELEDWLSECEPNIKLFESPYYWAAFCAIGQ